MTTATTALRFRRFILGLSQSEIAKGAGLSPARVSRLERGFYSRSKRDREARRRIAEFIGAPESVLFPGSTESDR